MILDSLNIVTNIQALQGLTQVTFVPSIGSTNKPQVMTVIFFLCGPIGFGNEPAPAWLAARVHSDPFVSVKSTGFMNSPLFVLQDIGQREKVHEQDV